jgi:phosphoglycolate phosphatase-like HAD superfamily hydrolase
MDKKIIVFDIDGTLANIQHRRQYVASRPKNWAAFNAGMKFDTVYEDIKWMNVNFGAQGHTIILCSGRSEESRDITSSWLNRNGIFFDDLYMRAAKDHRQDSIVKVELLEQIRQKYGEPWLWLDDRQQVVDAIRSQGVRVLQVAPGDF